MARPLIVLASTSRYRRELLERLRWPFEVHAPQVDETALPSETPRETALRLARDKAANVARHFPGAIVIGSDQTVDLNGGRAGQSRFRTKQRWHSCNRCRDAPLCSTPRSR